MCEPFRKELVMLICLTEICDERKPYFIDKPQNEIIDDCDKPTYVFEHYLKPPVPMYSNFSIMMQKRWEGEYNIPQDPIARPYNWLGDLDEQQFKLCPELGLPENYKVTEDFFQALPIPIDGVHPEMLLVEAAQIEHYKCDKAAISNMLQADDEKRTVEGVKLNQLSHHQAEVIKQTCEVAGHMLCSTK